MIARAYNPKTDTEHIKGVDVDPDRDVIVIVEQAGKVVSLVAMRPCLLLHDFALRDGLLKRQTTDVAMAYAGGAARAMGHREAIVIVAENNIRMRTWWEEHGAKLQDPGAVYMVEVQ